MLLRKIVEICDCWHLDDLGRSKKIWQMTHAVEHGEACSGLVVVEQQVVLLGELASDLFKVGIHLAKSSKKWIFGARRERDLFAASSPGQTLGLGTMPRFHSRLSRVREMLPTAFEYVSTLHKRTAFKSFYLSHIFFGKNYKFERFTSSWGPSVQRRRWIWRKLCRHPLPRSSCPAACTFRQPGDKITQFKYHVSKNYD